MDNNNKVAKIVIFLLALAVGGFLLYRRQNPPKIEGKVFDTTIKTQATTLDTTRIPPALPTDLPIEKGIILENKISENQVPDTSSFQIRQEEQSTYKYISEKTVEENKKIYLDYFEKNKWDIKYRDEKPDFITYLSQTSYFKGVLKVVISKNELTQDVYVELTVSK